MQRFYFSLDISAEQYLRYYQGTARQVVVRAHDSRRLSIPASSLRRFVTREGVKGCFCVTIDQNHRLVSLERQETP